MSSDILRNTIALLLVKCVLFIVYVVVVFGMILPSLINAHNTFEALLAIFVAIAGLTGIVFGAFNIFLTVETFFKE